MYAIYKLAWKVSIYQVMDSSSDVHLGEVPVEDGTAYTRDKIMVPDTVISDTGDRKEYKFKEIHAGSAGGPVYQNDPITANTNLYAIYEEV